MKKRVLIAPLDWGLGHATRCIPIIRELLLQGAEVILATSGSAYDLLHKEFPALAIERLPAYKIRYGSRNMFWNIATQLPHILQTVWHEHRCIRQMVQRLKVDAVISDSRFGCYHPHVHSIFISHQLQIQIPNFILKHIVNFANKQIIHRFDACWIPDTTGSVSLSGVLSENNFRMPVSYLGILSRMKHLDIPTKYDVVVVLSGPEPQRTLLEQKIIDQVAFLPQQFLIVQGRTDTQIGRLRLFENIEIVSFLASDALNETMAAADCVVGRSGYSSIMDLAMLGKKAILIPTPGQTEQEYLANRFSEKGIFYCQQQTKLDLRQALEKVKNFTGLNPANYEDAAVKLKMVVQEFLANH